MNDGVGQRNMGAVRRTHQESGGGLGLGEAGEGTRVQDIRRHLLLVADPPPMRP